jgi:hypothetical protein
VCDAPPAHSLRLSAFTLSLSFRLAVSHRPIGVSDVPFNSLTHYFLTIRLIANTDPSGSCDVHFASRNTCQLLTVEALHSNVVNPVIQPNPSLPLLFRGSHFSPTTREASNSTLRRVGKLNFPATSLIQGIRSRRQLLQLPSTITSSSYPSNHFRSDGPKIIGVAAKVKWRPNRGPFPWLCYVSTLYPVTVRLCSPKHHSFSTATLRESHLPPRFFDQILVCATLCALLPLFRPFFLLLEFPCGTSALRNRLSNLVASGTV